MAGEFVCSWDDKEYACPNCGKPIFPPGPIGSLGRSWCTTCEEYLVPNPVVEVETKTEETVPTRMEVPYTPTEITTIMVEIPYYGD